MTLLMPEARMMVNGTQEITAHHRDEMVNQPMSIRDKKLNNLIHLAVMSNDLKTLESVISQLDHNSCIELLESRNIDGFLPGDLPSSFDIQNHLKIVSGSCKSSNDAVAAFKETMKAAQEKQFNEFRNHLQNVVKSRTALFSRTPIVKDDHNNPGTGEALTAPATVEISFFARELDGYHVHDNPGDFSVGDGNTIEKKKNDGCI